MAGSTPNLSGHMGRHDGKCGLALSRACCRITALLIGPNGAGKSSIMNAVMGLLAISGRSMRFMKQHLGSVYPLPAARASEPTGRLSGPVRRSGTVASLRGPELAEGSL